MSLLINLNFYIRKVDRSAQQRTRMWKREREREMKLNRKLMQALDIRKQILTLGFEYSSWNVHHIGFFRNDVERQVWTLVDGPLAREITTKSSKVADKREPTYISRLRSFSRSYTKRQYGIFTGCGRPGIVWAGWYRGTRAGLPEKRSTSDYLDLYDVTFWRSL